MSSNISITVQNVSKKFHRHKQYTLKEFLPAILGGKPTQTSFWALKDINFSIKKGESFGIIGANGSGKSTLLKLIAGVSEPTNGNIKIDGRIAPLIELGAGFHPELTGKENIFLNGIILGLKRKDIETKCNDIVNFSELNKFIDEPVKHYSSGMYLRLAYSVAIHTKPDILLVDEILAVGDETFQHKCLDKLRSLQKNGVTTIIISHDRAIIKKFTHTTLLLDHGKQVMLGPTTEVLKTYINNI